MKMLDDSSLSGIDFSQGTFEQWQNGGGSLPDHWRQCHRQGFVTRFAHFGGLTSEKLRIERPSRLMVSQLTFGISVNCTLYWAVS